MPSRPVVALVAFSILSLAAPSSFAAQSKKYPKNLFATSALHFDSVRQAHGWDWYARSNEGKAVLGYIATSLGVAPIYVTIAKQAIPPARQVNEETFYNLPVPKGYAYCAARVSVVSINPADGERASVVNGKATKAGVEVATWTPAKHPGSGRSWAEGDMLVLGIKPQYLKEFVKKGVCKTPPPEGTGFISCRGRASCSTPQIHGNPARAAKSTPSLKRSV